MNLSGNKNNVTAIEHHLFVFNISLSLSQGIYFIWLRGLQSVVIYISFSVGQKFTYILLVLGSIAIWLLKLGSNTCFHKSLTILCSFLLTELVRLSQVSGPPSADTLFQLNYFFLFDGIHFTALWCPLQNFHVVILKPFCSIFGGRFRIISMLEGPVANKL